MRLLVVSLLCFLGVDADVDKTTRIFGGTDAKIDQHPYLVSIFDNTGKFISAGVIVSESWVVALGDTVYRAAIKGKMTIRAGSDSTINGGTQYSVEETVKHPSFNPGVHKYSYDFYMIKIKGTFTKTASVGFASLPSARLGANAAVVAVGFANPNTGGLRQGTMYWLSPDKCKEKHSPAVTFNSDTIGCAQNKGKTTLCEADVGAAFVKDGVLYGFFSRDITEGSCSVDAAPVLAADIYSVLGWIKETIAK